MGLLDFLFPRSGALSLPRPGELDVFADTAVRAQDAEVSRRAAQIAADANAYWQVGPIGNSNTGLLQSQDALVGTTPQPYIFLTDYMLAQLFADPVTRRACTEIPASIAAAGHIVTTPEGDDFLSAADSDHGISKAFADCHKRANHLRAGGILIDVEEEGEPPLSEPMDPAKVKRIRRLIPFGGLSLIVTKWQDCKEAVSPLWEPYQTIAQPELFQLNATFRTGAYNGPIHWTRLLYMQGVPLPPDVDGMLASPSSHFSLSVPDIIWAAVRRYTTTTANAERIGGQQGAWVFTVPNYAALQASAGSNPTGVFGTVSSWVAQMLSGFYSKKAMVAAPGFEVQAVTVNLSGWEQLEAGAYVQVANAARIPIQKIFTTLPAGLSSAPSDQWKPQYHDTLRTDFDEKWRGNLLRLYSLIYYLKTGQVAQLLTIRPGDWEEPSEAERMDLHVKGAQEIATLVEKGVITKEEARNRYTPTFTVDFPLDEAPPALPVAPLPTEEEDVPAADAPSHGAEMAAYLNGHNATMCGHARTNFCPICQVKALRFPAIGPDGGHVLGENGRPVNRVEWRAL